MPYLSWQLWESRTWSLQCGRNYLFAVRDKTKCEFSTCCLYLRASFRGCPIIQLIIPLHSPNATLVPDQQEDVNNMPNNSIYLLDEEVTKCPKTLLPTFFCTISNWTFNSFFWVFFARTLGKSSDVIILWHSLCCVYWLINLIFSKTGGTSCKM